MFDYFTIGFLTATVFWALIHIVVTRSYGKYLVSKAESMHRTALKLYDGFYYIVPEKEYNQLKAYRRSSRIHND